MRETPGWRGLEPTLSTVVVFRVFVGSGRCKKCGIYLISPTFAEDFSSLPDAEGRGGEGQGYGDSERARERGGVRA